MRRILLLVILAFTGGLYAGTTNIFMPNTTSPQTPSFSYYPGLQKGYELNYYNRPPTSYTTTGSDQVTTWRDQSGYHDTSPVDDTGTEKDITHIIQDPHRKPTR